MTEPSTHCTDPYLDIPADALAPTSTGKASGRITIATTEELLAFLPYMAGFQPDESLCVILFTGPDSFAMMGMELPTHPEMADTACEELADALLRLVFTCPPAHRTVVIAYGSHDHAAPMLATAGEVLDVLGVPNRELLRAEGEQYFVVARGSESAGASFDPDGEVARRARELGLVAYPSRNAVAASIDSVTGSARTAMVQATQHARTLHRDSLTHAEEECALVRRAIDTYAEGSALDDTDAARLSVAVTNIRVRDEAWVRIDPGNLGPHLALWQDMTRRAIDGVAPCASLLAYAAWQAGNWPLATAAINRALNADPSYHMAQLIATTLRIGVPPQADALTITPEELAEYYQGLDGTG